MISFGLSEEQEIAREAMRDYAKDRIRSQARDVDEEAEVPNEFLQEMWELGLTSTQISEEYGGGGEENSPIMNVILLEELGPLHIAANRKQRIQPCTDERKNNESQHVEDRTKSTTPLQFLRDDR